MNTNFEKYIKEAKRMAMTPDEKAAIFAHLKVAMEKDNEVSSPYFSYFQFSRSKVLVLAVLAVFLLTAGTSLAASSALPGDLLYPIKININEKIEAYVAAKSGDQANVEAKLAVNRLQEAEQLETEGRLDATSQKTIESNFKEHAANAQALLAASTSADFQAKLQVHRNILKHLSDVSDNPNKPILSSLIISVDEELNSNDSQATSSENASTTSVIIPSQSDRARPEKGRGESQKVILDSTTTLNIAGSGNASSSPPSGNSNGHLNSKLDSQTSANQSVGNVVNAVSGGLSI